MSIQTLVEQYAPDAIAQRRIIHQNPELAMHEFQTTALIRDALLEYGAEIQPISGMDVGVTAVIRGGKPGKTILLRADIDALALQEATELPFASQIDGRCHACGHDIHTTILLLTARVLCEKREELCGNIRLVFQPAEEGGRGASKMIRAGLMELEPKADCALSIHVSPEFPVGSIGLIKGPANASTDMVTITVKGFGGHGAHPYRCVDPIVAASYMVTQLQTIISRENPALQPAVLTFGIMQGGTAPNIIPTQIYLQGTLRAFQEEGRRKMCDAIHRVATHSCEAMRAEAIVEIDDGIPPLVNTPQVIDLVREAAIKTIGEDHIVDIPTPSPGSDDFAEFLKYSPGAQFRIGTGNGTPETAIGIHNPCNIFDEKSIPTAATVLTQYCIDFLV